MDNSVSLFDLSASGFQPLSLKPITSSYHDISLNNAFTVNHSGWFLVLPVSPIAIC